MPSSYTTAALCQALGHFFLCPPLDFFAAGGRMGAMLGTQFIPVRRTAHTKPANVRAGRGHFQETNMRQNRIVKWAGIVLLVALYVFVGSACNGGQCSGSLSALTDGKTIDARLGFSFADGVIESGPVVTWNKYQPDHIWGAGVFGFVNVTPNGTIPIRNLIPWVGDWLDLPETIEATVKIGGQIEPVNLAHEPDIYGAPAVQIATGPLQFEFRWKIVEGGQIEDMAKSGPAFFLGVRALQF